MTEHIYNAKITSTKLGYEDHGIPTGYLQCDLAGAGSQGFGGYDLRHGNGMLNFVMRVQQVLGVSDWSKVSGSFCRVVRRDGLLVSVGHILEDRWFHLVDVYDK